MHVRNKHGDKVEEFKKNFAEIKKTAVVKESSTRIQVPGPEPAKIEEKDDQKSRLANDAGHVHEIAVKEPEKKKEGDDKPPKGESFLEGFNKWLDSPEF